MSWLGIAELNRKINLIEMKQTSLSKTIEDLVSIGIDVHFTKPSMILIYSKLNGGQIRHIDANFESIRDLDKFIIELQQRFRTEIVTLDTHPGFRREKRNY